MLTSTSKLAKAFQNFRKPFKSLPCLSKTPKASKTFQSMHWTKALQSLTEVAKASKNLPKHPKTSKSLPMPSKAFQSLPKPSKTLRSIPKPSKASQSLTKPQGARTNGKSTEKHETICARHAFWNEKTRYSEYRIPINSGQQPL